MFQRKASFVITLWMAVVLLFTCLPTEKVFAAEIRITLDANGGSFTIWNDDAEDLVPSGRSSIVMTIAMSGAYYSIDWEGNYSEPVKTGRAFMGWSTAKDGTGDFYFNPYEGLWTTDSVEIPLDGSVKTLYAVWGDLYSLTLDANGGAFDSGETTSYVSIKYWSKDAHNHYCLVDGDIAPKKAGCKLTGWSVSSKASKPDFRTDLADKALKDLSGTKLYAFWSPLHTITLYGNGEGAFGYQTIGGKTDYLTQRTIDFYEDPWTGDVNCTEPMDLWPWSISGEQVLVAWSSGNPPTFYNAHLEDLTLDSNTPTELFACFISKDITTSTEVDGLSDQIYTGKAIKPEVIVKAKLFQTSLTEGQDYTVSYENNTKAGTAGVIITGTGEFTGTIRKTFTILPLAVTPKVTLSKKSYTYDGKSKKPSVTVSVGGSKLSSSAYDVTYASGRKNAGKYKVTVDLKGNYTGSKTVSFTINKTKQPMTVKAKTVTVKASKLKKKNLTVSRSKALTLKKAKGTVTYKKIKGPKKISIDKKTGKITLKKGLKKGSYSLKVKVTAKGTTNYLKGSKTVTIKIKVKV